MQTLDKNVRNHNLEHRVKVEECCLLFSLNKGKKTLIKRQKSEHMNEQQSKCVGGRTDLRE